MAAVPGFLVRNWPLKAAAVVLSCILWVLVASEETTSQLVNVQVEVELPAALALAKPVPQLRALVTGPTRELIKLYAGRPVLHAIVPATATPPQWRLPVQPGDVVLPRSAKVVIQDLEPRAVVLDLDRFVERDVPVRLRGTVEPESGYSVEGRLVLAPATVRVSGPSALVRGLESVPTEAIEIRGMTGRFERTVPLDTAAHPMLRYAPREVTVSGRTRRS